MCETHPVFCVERKTGVLWDAIAAGPFKVVRNKIDGEYDVCGVDVAICPEDAWEVFDACVGETLTSLELECLLRFGFPRFTECPLSTEDL